METYYRGDKIILTPSQLDNGKWTCKFTIVKFGSAEMESLSAYADGSFDSPEEAEDTALAKAIASIESQ